MFRTALSLTLIYLVLPTVSAEDISSGPNADGRVPGNATSAFQITENYVQTQLDWRSYYLNRMTVRRHDLPHDTTTWHQPTAAPIH
jgi:hypothetical protein